MKFEKYHLASTSKIITKSLPGPNATQLLNKQEFLESNNRSYPRGLPLAPTKARGTIVEDVDGNYFLDFFSFCGVVNLGHNNEEILKAVTKQSEELIHAMDYPTETKISFMENFNDHLPQNIKNNMKFNFCGPTGTDAIEAAIKLSMINSGKHSLIAFQGSYHGMTAGSLSATSSVKHKKGLNATAYDVAFTPFSYCYRCPFNKKPDSCQLDCAKQLENMLDNPHSGLATPAAVLLEPIQGEGGVIIPKDGFHRKIQKICNDRGITLIHDEVQAGFFRTGTLLSSQHFDVTPDIIAMSKGIGGVGIPLALLLINKNVDNWAAGTHAGTFRGHQLGMAAGKSALKFIDKHQVADHVAKIGKMLLDGLCKIQSKSKFIGDVRGIGLFIGVEYVVNKQNKLPYDTICTLLRRKLFENGILVEVGGYYSNVIRILPPLITTEKMVQDFLETFEKLNKEIEINPPSL